MNALLTTRFAHEKVRLQHENVRLPHEKNFFFNKSLNKLAFENKNKIKL